MKTYRFEYTVTVSSLEPVEIEAESYHEAFDAMRDWIASEFVSRPSASDMDFEIEPAELYGEAVKS